MGVWIRSKEGSETINMSDFALGKFKFLKNLLLVHEKRNYSRMAMVILYSFYKNFVLVLPNFYLIFYNSGSGTCLYEYWLVMSFILIFTSLPIIVLGCLDLNLDNFFSLKYPQLFWRGISNFELNFKTFLNS